MKVEKLQIVEGKGGWFWRIIAANGKTRCHSESYSSKAAADRGGFSAINAIQSRQIETEIISKEEECQK